MSLPTAEQRHILHHGITPDALTALPDNSIDAVVTDPPYGLAFMGKKWDYDVPTVAVWEECLRVLKPGGHLLAFFGTRTYHRGAVRVEDAGFELRDMIAWVYGSGFPKSKNLDGDWQGWGTALKPALEPIVVARKPLVGTVADNVLRYGTGALNVDGCRVETSDVLSFGNREIGNGVKYGTIAKERQTEGVQSELGRWPANLIHDGSEDVTVLFPETNSGGYPAEGGMRSQVSTYGAPTARGPQAFTGSTGSAARFFYCAKADNADRHSGLTRPGPQFQHGTTLRKVENTDTRGNHHPTVKPTDLMRYLCRLVCPPGGVILDPFMGSGSTGKAAMLEGFRFIGVEQDEGYYSIACARIADAAQQLTLFC